MNPVVSTPPQIPRISPTFSPFIVPGPQFAPFALACLLMLYSRIVAVAALAAAVSVSALPRSSEGPIIADVIADSVDDLVKRDLAVGSTPKIQERKLLQRRQWWRKFFGAAAIPFDTTSVEIGVDSTDSSATVTSATSSFVTPLPTPLPGTTWCGTWTWILEVVRVGKGRSDMTLGGCYGLWISRLWAQTSSPICSSWSFSHLLPGFVTKPWTRVFTSYLFKLRSSSSIQFFESDNLDDWWLMMTKIMSESFISKFQPMLCT